MIKIIFKNLWARRRKNGWLLAELIVVSIISWVVLDPVIVVSHDRNIPLGYDAERLFVVTLETLSPQARGYDAKAQEQDALIDSYMNLVRRVKDFEGVELATPLLGSCFPNSNGTSSTQYNAEGDTISVVALQMQFLPHTQFFETYGFKPSDGLTPEQLSDYNYTQNDIVLTENTILQLFHTSNRHNKTCWVSYSNDTINRSIIGSVGTFKAFSDWRPVAVAFSPALSVGSYNIPHQTRILVRIKANISMERFLHDFHPFMVKQMRMGNLFARSAISYEDIIKERESRGATHLYRRNLAMAIFFLINLCLGVIGTFWLQTRTRCEEVGIMLSFGSTRSRIICMLMAEGALLTFIASLTGFLLYLQYALSEGLFKGRNGVESTDNYWVSDFTSHFLFVSLIIFMILLAVVLAGIYIPARNISRIPPTEALRNE